MIYTNITGIILAGGKSTRMGQNKSFLNLNGKTVIERIVRLMKSIFHEVIIITNTPDEYDFINIPLYKDIFEYKGPLAGIHSGLTHSNNEKNFVISCDTPLMEQEMIEFIINYKTDKPITVCRADGFVQQLVGLYSNTVLKTISNLLTTKNQNSSVLSLLDKIVPEIINVENYDIYKEHMFFNMNRPEDYDKIKILLS